MWIKRITVENVGPFAAYDVELTRGAIGVFGSNGSGKSTLINLVYAALTGDFGRFAGLKVDCINNRAATKAKSFIAVSVEHGDAAFQITRRLRPAGAELVVAGEKPTSDANKIQVALDGLLGVDKAMLDRYVFKTQDRIYDFLSATQAERAKAYQTLCRTERCTEVHAILGAALVKTKAEDQVVDNSDELAQRQAALLADRDRYAGEIAAQQPILLNQVSEAAAKDIVRKRQRWEDLQGDLGRLELDLPALTKAAADAAEAAVQADQVVASFEGAVEKVKKRADDARADLQNLDLHRKAVTYRRSLEAEAIALTKEELDRVVPKRPHPDDLEVVRSECAELQASLQRALKVRDSFRDDGMVACPTCDTPVAHLSVYLASQKALLRTIPPRLAARQEIARALLAYEGEVVHYQRWAATHKAKVEAIQKALAAPVGKAVKVDEVACRAAVATHADAVSMLARKRPEAERRRADAATLTERLAARIEAVTKAKADIAANLVPDEKVAKATRRLAEHEVARLAVARLEGEQAGVERELRQVKTDLAAVRARLARGRRARQAAAVAERVYNAMHWSALPNRVAQINLGRMVGAINDGLGRFSNPYWVEADDKLSFVAHKPGEPPQSAERLSTGQKVVLGLCFWPAVAALWAADLGVLCLDEPTANLDQDNRALLGEALSALSQQVRGRRQLLMVTHDHELRSCFDQVIEL